MSWFNSFKKNKKNESALTNLSKKIFENSLLCAESLKPDLEEKFGKDTKQLHSKYTSVLFESEHSTQLCCADAFSKSM